MTKIHVSIQKRHILVKALTSVSVTLIIDMDGD